MTEKSGLSKKAARKLIKKANKRIKNRHLCQERAEKIYKWIGFHVLSPWFKAELKDMPKDVSQKIQPLEDVGLGYIKLGQASSTLSGGEAQRVKLASYLGKSNSQEHIFFIFDEPTTGLHFHDINKLLSAMQALIEKGHTVLIVEHNLEVIKSADWLIDLGPDGGDEGGELLYQGKP